MTPDEYAAALAVNRLAVNQTSSASWRGRVALAEADARPGAYYVTTKDERGRTAYLLGPFVQHRPGQTAHARALGYVRRARLHIFDNYPRSHEWTFGTARIARIGAPLPTGKLNAALLPGRSEA